MELEDRLPNESMIIIKVNTNFKPQVEDGEDFRTEVIKSFHNAVHFLIEKYLIENDSFEQNILELMNDTDELPKGVKEFNDLGSISINMEEQSVKVKQKNLDEDELKKYFFKEKVDSDKSQTKLNKL